MLAGWNALGEEKAKNKKIPKKGRTKLYCCGANDSEESGCLFNFREYF